MKASAAFSIRLSRITWRPHVALWIQRWLYAELIAKGAQVDDTWTDVWVWECRW